MRVPRHLSVMSAVASAWFLLPIHAASAQANIKAGEQGRVDEIDQIIVTARRRSEELQHAPVSVISLSAHDLEKRSVTNLRSLQNFIPNLTFAPSQNVGDAAGNIFIRGIGQEDFVAGTEAGVGFYLDGVYVARTMGTMMNLLDIERIEVLRGPQGTLYGKNTIGGAINVISAAPTEESQVQADLIFGNIGRFDARGMVNVPLSDRLLVRLTAGHFSRDGYLKRLPPPFPPTAITETNHEAEGSEESLSGRLQLRWLASRLLTIDVAADASRRRGTQAATHVDAIDPRFGILPTVNFLVRSGKLPGPEITNDIVTSDWLTSYAAGSNSISQNVEGVAVTATGQFGRHSVKLIAAHRRLRSEVGTDLDGTWFSILGNDFAEHHRQATVELQASGTVGRVTYTAGLFAFSEEMQTTSGRSRRADVIYLCGCFYPTTGRPVLSYTSRRQSGESHAGYAQASFNLVRRLSATLGGRFSHERKKTKAELIQLDPDTLFPTGLVLATGKNRGQWNSFTWRAGIEFEANADLMIYGSAAKGYKSGGFNTRPVSNLPNLGINNFAPETAVTYEAGFRSLWFDRHLRFNATLFHASYRDIQLRQQTFFDGILTTLIENAAQARIRGVEVEAEVKLTPRLAANVAYGHINPRYLDVGTVPGLTLDSDFQRTPHHSIVASFDYSVPLRSYRLRFHGDYSYRSREQFQVLASPFDQPGYGTLGFRLSVHDPEDRWLLALFGTNLTDKRYRAAGRDGLRAVGIANSVIGAPRSVGVEFKAGL